MSPWGDPEGGSQSHGEGQLHCTSTHQSHQVPGVFAAEVTAAAEDDEGDKEDGVGDVVGPDIALDKAPHALGEGEGGHKGEGDAELQGEYQEDLGVVGEPKGSLGGLGQMSLT